MTVSCGDKIVRNSAGADQALFDAFVRIAITERDLPFLDASREDDAVRARGAVHALGIVGGREGVVEGRERGSGKGFVCHGV